MSDDKVASMIRARSLTSRMNDLMEKVQSHVGSSSCNAECQDNRDIKKKKREWEKAKALYDLGISNVDDKERIYLNALYGPRQASEVLVKKYKKQAAQTIEKQRDRLNDINERNELNLTNLDSVLRSQAGLRRLMKVLTTERDQLQKAIRSSSADINTNDERTRFSDDALSRLKTYLRILQVLYVIVFLIFIFRGPFYRNQEFYTVESYILPAVFLLTSYFSRFIAYRILHTWNNVVWYFTNKSPKDVYIDLR